jgi:hypothetical protein
LLLYVGADADDPDAAISNPAAGGVLSLHPPRRREEQGRVVVRRHDEL